MDKSLIRSATEAVVRDASVRDSPPSEENQNSPAMNTSSNRRQFLVQAGSLAGSAFWASAAMAAEPSRNAAAADAPAVPLAPPDKQPKDLPIPEPVPRKLGWAVVG